MNGLIAIDRNGFRRMKKEGLINKTMRWIFKFLPWDLVMIFQSLVMILPRFSTLKDHNEVPGQTKKNLRQGIVAMNMTKKFYKDSLSCKKVKFNLPNVIELSEKTDFVYNFE